MKIETIIKGKKGMYELVFSNGKKKKVTEDIIIKYNLFKNKEIDAILLNKIIEDNEKEIYYNKVIKYIAIRIRSKWEIEKYLEKYETDTKYIIDKLERQGYINDEIFIRAFINDKMNMNNWGPFKIKREAFKYHIDSSLLNKYISEIDIDIIHNKLEKQINKKVGVNKTKSERALKTYLMTYFSNLGYESSMIKQIISGIEINVDQTIIDKEYNKIKKRLEKKYQGKELEFNINRALLNKGFDYKKVTKK